MLSKPESCKPCPIYGDGKGYSIVSGTGEVPLLVIAEASGRNERRLGRPLIESAPAGGVFEKALNVGKLTRDVVSLTNVLRCQPPQNLLKGEVYERAAIDHCRQYLDQAIAERKPRLLLALGDVPLRELSLVGGTISELRGYVLPSRYDIPMIATYHPSHLARGAFGQLFGVFMHDVRTAYKFAQCGVPDKLETHYILSPTRSEIVNYLDRLRSQPELPAAYDIETEGILGIKEPEEWSEKKIIQIQFSSGVGEALVLDWANNDHRDAAKKALATPNLKWDWWGRLFDRKVLRAQGVTINGETHDLCDAAAHLQPGFVSGKDELSGDKGVPSKLMSLQSWVSFYWPQEGVWKSEMRAAMHGGEASMDNIRWGGSRDVDMTFRLGQKIFNSLKKLGLW